jgi:hypothetical protein
MSYFNHAFKKSFVATKDTQAASNPGTAGGRAGVTNGILTSTGIHVSKLKSTAASEGYLLGPGVVGLFNAKTDESILGAGIASGCLPFYLGAAAIKTNDKQGPFHGGYQEATKSKIINPKFLRKAWKVIGNAGSQAILEVGGTEGNNGGAPDEVVTFDVASLVGGTTYVTAAGVATTGGTGTGLTVDITAAAGAVTVVAIANPGTGYTVGDTITIAGGDGAATIDVATIAANVGCVKEFMCGETYYLRIDVKGTPALRFANHFLYRTLQADGGCCVDPSNPQPVDPAIIYAQWATAISIDPYLSSFVQPLLVVDNQSYAKDADTALSLGLLATDIFANAPVTSTTAGLVLMGAYVDTTFQNCTFQVSDYFGVVPVQIYASEVDYQGDPCTFGGLCVTEICPGIQANGTGEQKVRDLILSESYLQNFTHSDLRIREITQGTRAYEVLDRAAIYSSMYLLHSVPRYSNPSSTYDNDQYLLEVVGSSAMVGTLETQINAIIGGDCTAASEIEDMSSVVSCSYTIPGL